MFLKNNTQRGGKMANATHGMLLLYSGLLFCTQLNASEEVEVVREKQMFINNGGDSSDTGSCGDDDAWRVKVMNEAIRNSNDEGEEESNESE